MIATIRRKGQLTIPEAALRAVHLEEGDEVEVEVIEDGIVLRRCEVEMREDRAPWYYGTPEWEEGLTQALADEDAGRTTHHDSDEAFLAALDRRSKRAQVDR